MPGDNLRASPRRLDRAAVAKIRPSLTVRSVITEPVRVKLLCLLVCGLLAPPPAFPRGEKPEGKQKGGASRLVGDWPGESVCVDKEKFPACNDEQVVYRVALPPGKPDAVTITMDKIVNGKPETMGTLDFAYDAQKQTLSGEFNRNGRHGIFEFAVSGDRLEGTLSTLPGRAAVRRINVKKDK